MFWKIKRLINLIYAYDFYAVSSNKSDKKKFQYIIYKHYIINKIYIKSLPTNKLSIENSFLSKISNVFLPTFPVAPTIAIFMI